MTVNLARFYRKGTTQFVLARALPRSGAEGFKSTESWEPCSGKFNDVNERVGGYYDIYTDVYNPGPYRSNRSAMYYVKATWVANKSDTTADLTTKVNAAANAAGYRRPDGSAIT